MSTLAPRRRCHPRADLSATALVFTRSRVVGPCVVDDFSQGGIRLTCDAPLRRGQHVRVLLDLPSFSGHVVSAEVCRHDRTANGLHVVGLVFIGLSTALASALETLVAERLVADLPSIEFFDTENGGSCKRIVLGDAPLLVKDREVSPL